MNIDNYQGALAITNEPLITSPAPLVFLYFNKIQDYYIQYFFHTYVQKYKKTNGECGAINRSLVISISP